MASNVKKNKLNCPSCEKGSLIEKEIIRKLEIDGAPEVDVTVTARVCSNCQEVFVSEKSIVLANKYFLEKLLFIYLKDPSTLPGKVATWIRKEISLSARELAELAGLKESTLSHANTNNSVLDRFAATVLLLLANDKLNDTTVGRETIGKLSNLVEFWHKGIPTAEIVEQIKSRSEIAMGRLESLRKRTQGVVRTTTVVRTHVSGRVPLMGFHNQSPYGLKKQNHR